MNRISTVTKWFAVLIGALAAWSVTPQGSLLISHNKYLSAASVLLGGLAALLHNPKKD